MKISLSAWSVHRYLQSGHWNQADFIDFAGTTGVDGVELLSVFWRNRQREIPLIRGALERNSLDLACFGACNNLAVSDAGQRRSQLRDITDSVDDAVRFGARVVRVFSGDKPEDIEYERAKEWIIKGLTEASAYAEQRGVTLCLENHGLFAGRAAQVEDIIRSVGSPALRSTFDTGNFLLVDEDPTEAIRVLKERVAHVHFKDFATVDESYVGHIYRSITGRSYAGRVPGEGDVDLKSVLRELSLAGYKDWLTVEYEGDEEQQSGSRRSVHILRDILSQL